MIIVKNLNIDAYESITYDLTSRWAKTVFETAMDDCVDVEIDPKVILTTSASRDAIKLDFGGKVSYMGKSDYYEVIIR